MATPITGSGEWKFKQTTEKNKRAEYLKALQDIMLDLSNAAEPLAKLEYVDNEFNKKNVIGIIEATRVKLTLLEKNL